MDDGLNEEGPAAPPRDNGELVFAAPWQGRAFGLTVALHQAGRFEWDEFRDRLIAELADATDADPSTYWSAWLRATEAVVTARSLVEPQELDDRRESYRSGHDHDHPLAGS